MTFGVKMCFQLKIQFLLPYSNFFQEIRGSKICSAFFSAYCKRKENIGGCRWVEGTWEGGGGVGLGAYEWESGREKRKYGHRKNKLYKRINQRVWGSVPDPLWSITSRLSEVSVIICYGSGSFLLFDTHMLSNWLVISRITSYRYYLAVVGKLLLKSSWGTLLQLLVKVTRYF
jgi:hypothetical protein